MKITLLFQLDLLLFANPNQHPPLSLARMSSIPRGEEFSRFKMSSEIDLHYIFTFTQVVSPSIFQTYERYQIVRSRVFVLRIAPGYQFSQPSTTSISAMLSSWMFATGGN